MLVAILVAILVTLRRVVITSDLLKGNRVLFSSFLFCEMSKQSRKQRANADSCCHGMALLMMDQWISLLDAHFESLPPPPGGRLRSRRQNRRGICDLHSY
jgi:hypothetical protein